MLSPRDPGSKPNSIPSDGNKRPRKITQAPEPIQPISGGHGAHLLSRCKEEKAENKLFPIHGIDGGTLMERWEIYAGDLANLIFNYGLRAWDVQRQTWVVSHPVEHSWMAGPGAFMKGSDLGAVAALPIEVQKRIVSGMVTFDADDIEAFEGEHKELLLSKKAVIPTHESDHQTGNSTLHDSIDKVINMWCKQGDSWIIIFNDNKLPLLKDLDGYRYIQYLLQNPDPAPDKEISALELYNKFKGVKPDIKSDIAKDMVHTINDDQEDEESELYISKGDKYFEPIDEKARQEYKERLKTLNSEREEAEIYNDKAAIDRINSETESIEKVLKNSAYDYKKGTVNEEKARKNVSRRIKLVINKINKHDKDFADYLSKNIKLGIKCVYTPDKTNPIQWSF